MTRIENAMRAFPIPKVEFPTIREFQILSVDEPLVSLRDAGFRVKSKYYEAGIPGSYKDCYARRTVVRLLGEAKESLPSGYDFKVFDGYRPICVQQRLWNMYHRRIANENPGMSEEEVDKRTSFFVSRPSYDVKHPSLHNTGGAIDLTLVGPDGKELDMGTEFDDFSGAAWTNHFEPEELQRNSQKEKQFFAERIEAVRNNRRILYYAMTSVGFTNLPSEWWHYDYGTKFWAYFTGGTALYDGILDADFPDRFPVM